MPMQQVAQRRYVYHSEYVRLEAHVANLDSRVKQLEQRKIIPFHPSPPSKDWWRPIYTSLALELHYQQSKKLKMHLVEMIHSDNPGKSLKNIQNRLSAIRREEKTPST